MRVFTEVGVHLDGDTAEKHISHARTLLGIMKNTNNGLAVQHWDRRLPDGTQIVVDSIHGQDYISIFTSPDADEEEVVGSIRCILSIDDYPFNVASHRNTAHWDDTQATAVAINPGPPITSSNTSDVTVVPRGPISVRHDSSISWGTTSVSSHTVDMFQAETVGNSTSRAKAFILDGISYPIVELTSRAGLIGVLEKEIEGVTHVFTITTDYRSNTENPTNRGAFFVSRIPKTDLVGNTGSWFSYTPFSVEPFLDTGRGVTMDSTSRTQLISPLTYPSDKSLVEFVTNVTGFTSLEFFNVSSIFRITLPSTTQVSDLPAISRTEKNCLTIQQTKEDSSTATASTIPVIPGSEFTNLIYTANDWKEDYEIDTYSGYYILGTAYTATEYIVYRYELTGTTSEKITHSYSNPTDSGIDWVTGPDPLVFYEDVPSSFNTPLASLYEEIDLLDLTQASFPDDSGWTVSGETFTDITWTSSAGPEAPNSRTFYAHVYYPDTSEKKAWRARDAGIPNGIVLESPVVTFSGTPVIGGSRIPYYPTRLAEPFAWYPTGIGSWTDNREGSGVTSDFIATHDRNYTNTSITENARDLLGELTIDVTPFDTAVQPYKKRVVLVDEDYIEYTQTVTRTKAGVDDDLVVTLTRAEYIDPYGGDNKPQQVAAFEPEQKFIALIKDVHDAGYSIDVPRILTQQEIDDAVFGGTTELTIATEITNPSRPAPSKQYEYYRGVGVASEPISEASPPLPISLLTTTLDVTGEALFTPPTTETVQVELQMSAPHSTIVVDPIDGSFISPTSNNARINLSSTTSNGSDYDENGSILFKLHWADSSNTTQGIHGISSSTDQLAIDKVNESSGSNDNPLINYIRFEATST